MKTILFIVIAALFSPASSSSEHRYQFKKNRDSSSYDEYVDSLGLPKLSKRSIFGRGFYGDFYGILTEKQGIKVMAVARYPEKAYTLYEADDRLYLQNEDSYYLGRLGEKHASSFFGFNDPIAYGIKKNGDLIAVYKNYYYVGIEKYRLPTKALSAFVSRNHEGDANVAFIGDNYHLYIEKNNKFSKINIGLNDRSDLKNILSLYGTSGGDYYLAAYIYKNKINKSLTIFKLSENPAGSLVITSNVIISSSSNGKIGLNPSIYLNEDTLMVSSKFNDEHYSWELALSDLEGESSNSADSLVLASSAPSYKELGVAVDNTPDMLDINITYSRMTPNRKIEQSARAFSSYENIGSVNYDLNRTPLDEYSLQGKFLGTPIVLVLSKSKTSEDKNFIEAKASEKIYGSVGLDNLFVGGETLRVEVSRENIGGVATYTDSFSTANYQFENIKSSIGLYRAKEQGRYWGVQFTKSKIPSVLGLYTYDEDLDIAIFDPNLAVKKLTFRAGFSEEQFSNRYLFNYSKPYYSWDFGIGGYIYQLSSQIKKQAQSHFSASMQEGSNIGLALDAGLEVGYMFQRRSEGLKGLGFNIQISYALNSTLYLDNLSDYSERHDLPDENYVAAFRRQETWHGPKLQIGLVF